MHTGDLNTGLAPYWNDAKYNEHLNTCLDPLQRVVCLEISMIN